MKTIIITGANGNLGTAVTQQFLDTGYKVFATVINEAEQHAMPKHPNLEVRVVNVMQPAETQAFVQEAVASHGQLHAAIMLVGGFAMGDIGHTPVEDVTKMVALNFNTAFNIAQPGYLHMNEKGYGRLVFIGARPALNAHDGKGVMAYALSKSMLFKFAELLNADAKSKNVVAVVVVPSTIDTPVNRKSMPDADPEKWVKPQQLAEVLEFVCSEKADAIREPVIKVYNNA